MSNLVAILLRVTDFLPQEEKMPLTANFPRNAHKSVVAEVLSGPSSGMASAVKAVKRKIGEKECSDQVGHGEIERLL